MDHIRHSNRAWYIIILFVFVPLIFGSAGDRTFTGDVTLSHNQDYTFSSRGTGLTLQSKTSNSPFDLEFYTGDGDSTDNLWLRLFAHGLPTDLTDSEYLIFGFYPSQSAWTLYSLESQNGTLWPIKIGAGSYTDQLVLNTDGSVSLGGDVKMPYGSGIMFETGPSGGYSVWLKPPDGYASYTIRLPSDAAMDGASGNFMTIGDDGETIAFMSTASYEGDIQSVWTDEGGDVGAMTAAAGDTLDATSADSTVPWRVNTTASPTTEGAAIWDSDDNMLNVGDGANTLTLGPLTQPPTSASSSGILGQMAYDSKYLYCYVATNTWKRTLLSTWSDSYLIMETGDKVLTEDSDFTILE
jgi:hypothetical protein